MSTKKKTPHKPGWFDIFSDSMAAAAFAEANEPDMAREILATSGATSDTVLFVMQDGNLHRRAMQYAVNLCHRMECGLAVLNVFSPQEKETPTVDTPSECFEEMPDVPTSLHAARGELPRAVRRFLNDHRSIVSVVVDGAVMEQNGSKRRPAKRRKWWRELNCPVVFIPAS